MAVYSRLMPLAIIKFSSISTPKNTLQLIYCKKTKGKACRVLPNFIALTTVFSKFSEGRNTLRASSLLNKLCTQ